MGTIRLATNGLSSVPARATAAVRRGLETISDGMAQVARNRVPVRTGALLESISNGVTEAEGGRVVRAEVSAGTEPGQPITTASGAVVDVTYAGFVEYGTSRQPAQPFLTPAVEEYEGEVATILANVLGRELGRGG